jgi:hypothetical protein
MPTRRAPRILPVTVLALAAACSWGAATMERATAVDSAAPTVAAVDSFAAADSGAEAEEVPQVEEVVRINALDGPLTIEVANTHGAGPAEIKVQGRTVAVDSFVYGMSVEGWWESPADMVPGRLEIPGEDWLKPLALIEVGLGGTGCPALFRIVELVSRDSVAVTQPFGTCMEAPQAVWFTRDGALHMRFDSYAPNFVRMDPGYVEAPPTTWIYRTGGRLREVKGR